ncbi:MAG: hypothetical protein ACR2NB_09810 [Solirubrobacteraceae bacterium]
MAASDLQDVAGRPEIEPLDDRSQPLAHGGQARWIVRRPRAGVQTSITSAECSSSRPSLSARGVAGDLEDHAPCPARRGQVELHTARESRVVASVSFAAQQQVAVDVMAIECRKRPQHTASIFAAVLVPPVRSPATVYDNPMRAANLGPRAS